MEVITPFDPWKDPLCTCPPKYTCSPYVGCGHACIYCYISSYIPRAFAPRPKVRFIKRLLRDLRKIDHRLPISMANSSDPYTPPEERLLLTRGALQILLGRGYKVQILTKSCLVLRDLDLIRKGNCTVSITITTLDMKLACKLEPGASAPRERMKAFRVLSRAEVPCTLRLDPIIPGINDDEKELERVIKQASEAGVKHVVASTFKARPDGLKRLINAFPKQADRLQELYLERGERKKRMVWYLPRGLREEILKMVKTLVEEYGMTFATCREGLSHLNNSPTCDGTHLIPSRVRPSHHIMEYRSV
ncbi:MAG: radical SAM protein [Thermoprotei archaeon]|nr:MAG: radical SAM protein [Thermoprotei archaeon]RLF25813.1 MAG: radical SAM protein [Thermoprotei archaeon]